MFGAMAIMFAMDKVLNTGYMAAFSGAQVNSISGLIGMLVGFCLYCIISLILVYGCFRLVQTVPDAILQWIGGRDDDSIGVEQHGDKVGATALSFKDQAHGAGRNAMMGKGAGGGKKDKPGKEGGGTEAAAEARDHSQGTSGGENSKG
jgi:hypothetical protein